ncbi:MAG: hypothetical protein A3J63_01450 [Candidatus Moranbacteria bacterium RIFCSPHIGHO2_02_FULL_40_12b]|nr:MAG: hypothetical protein A3J63_01450 [Candidatus Moranbacteria bacterium RIFCSPHIGHO2_02_FULL_40_12b]OGI23831.1 MAG: hypothetical protein A3E91_00345 [Candidatus Moranbacteria bacterium RIFCSPHIGHO2_12_FULL_40_10]
MEKEFDLKEKLRIFHAERVNFKKLAATPRGVKSIVSEIKKNRLIAITGADMIDYLNSMCQVSVSFVALKNELQKYPELLQELRERGLKHIE